MTEPKRPAFPDVCVSCGSPVHTLRNVTSPAYRGPETLLRLSPAPCTCAGPCEGDADPTCPSCYPVALVCHACA